jgi:hypothetical protein
LMTEQNQRDASSARRDEGAGWAPVTEEQRSDAPQIVGLATDSNRLPF